MKPNPQNTHRIETTSRRAFTLVEMLLVLVILSTLAAIIYPSVLQHGRRARIIGTKAQIKIFRTALSTFEMDNDRFPKGPNGLLELVQRPTDARNWRGPYLDNKTIPKDRWGNDFIYECPGKENPESYDIISMGPDGLPGTEDDITSWQLDE